MICPSCNTQLSLSDITCPVCAQTSAPHAQPIAAKVVAVAPALSPLLPPPSVTATAAADARAAINARKKDRRQAGAALGVLAVVGLGLVGGGVRYVLHLRQQQSDFQRDWRAYHAREADTANASETASAAHFAQQRAEEQRIARQQVQSRTEPLSPQMAQFVQDDQDAFTAYTVSGYTQQQYLQCWDFLYSCVMPQTDIAPFISYLVQLTARSNARVNDILPAAGAIYIRNFGRSSDSTYRTLGIIGDYAAQYPDLHVYDVARAAALNQPFIRQLITLRSAMYDTNDPVNSFSKTQPLAAAIIGIVSPNIPSMVEPAKLALVQHHTRQAELALYGFPTHRSSP